MSRRYFEEEMRYLYEAGRLFAEAHPEQARFLNVDAIADRDPYVERLFEGFAFLTGRIHERLDDDLPQYTESLCRVLYPQFIRPVPSCTLISFSPRPGQVQSTTVIEKGTEVRSGPVGAEEAICRFRTTRDVRLHPISLQDVRLEWLPDGTSKATLDLRLVPGVDYSNVQLSPLRLHFLAPPTLLSWMHLFFTQHVSGVTLRAEGGPFEGDPVHLRGQEWVRPGGLSNDEALLPYPDNAFEGYRLIHEYLCYREKFWCVDLHGLDRLRGDVTANSLKVEVQFDRAFPEDLRFNDENIRLFTTPAVNLFDHQAEPIRANHRSPEYRVWPSSQYRRSIEIYSIEEVTGIEDATGRRHDYLPFTGFRHGREPGQRFFTETISSSVSSRYELSIALDSLEPDDNGELPTETLSLDILCTNGTLPRERLREGALTRAESSVTDLATFENVTRPSLILYPPVQEKTNFFWKLIAHWSLNYRSVATREAVSGLIELYDWTDSKANKRRLDGLREVNWDGKERMHRGAIYRGGEVTVKVHEDNFTNEGDAVLLGLILSRTFEMYTTLNAFTDTTLELIPSGRRYAWTSKNGQQPLL
ncbi:MAG: type VI secretion system baseplate subunit TssF [Bacteroidetes bacterium]|jgi:type VI secretion system protein ImpG|nr:type VI secretion system baseplate subunit TssF [Bacteroidota bacterium]